MTSETSPVSSVVSKFKFGALHNRDTLGSVPEEIVLRSREEVTKGAVISYLGTGAGIQHRGMKISFVILWGYKNMKRSVYGIRNYFV